MEQSGEGVTSSDLHNDGLMPERAVQDDEEDILAQQRCHTTAQTNKKRGTVSHAIGERIPDTDLQSATAQSLQEVCTVEDFYRVLWRNQKKEPWEKRGLGSCAKTAVKTVMKTMGPMLIFLALALVVAVTYNYFAVLAPIALGTFSIKHLWVQWWIATIPGLFLLSGLLFNYIACTGTFPGHPSDVIPYDIIQAAIDSSRSSESQSGRKDKPLRHYNSISSSRPACKRCDFPKPPRTHHDSVMAECVCRMDHFCPWMGNTIGHYNYRYFFMSLFYIFAACMFITCISLPLAVALLSKRLKNPTEALTEEELTLKEHRKAVMFSFALCLSMSIAVGLMLAWNTFLVQKNFTTIEFYGGTNKHAVKLFGGVSRHVYDMGSRSNWEAVFGLKNRFQMFLPSFQLPLGNGVDYPTTSEPGLLFAQRADWLAVHDGTRGEYSSVGNAEAHKIGHRDWYIAAAKYGHLRPFGRLLQWLSIFGIVEDPLRAYAKRLYQLGSGQETSNA